MSPNHSLALKKDVSLGDLLNYPYIGWSEYTGLHDILRDAFEKECGEQPVPKVCPEIPYMSYLNLKKIDPQGKRWIRPFGLIYRSESRQVPIIKNFVSFAEQQIKKPVFVYAHPQWAN